MQGTVQKRRVTVTGSRLLEPWSNCVRKPLSLLDHKAPKYLPKPALHEGGALFTTMYIRTNTRMPFPRAGMEMLAACFPSPSAGGACTGGEAAAA